MPLYWVLLVGDASVGKSSMIQRFMVDSFSPDIKATEGASGTQREIQLKQGPARLQVCLPSNQLKCRYTLDRSVSLLQALDSSLQELPRAVCMSSTLPCKHGGALRQELPLQHWMKRADSRTDAGLVAGVGHSRVPALPKGGDLHLQGSPCGHGAVQPP